MSRQAGRTTRVHTMLGLALLAGIPAAYADTASAPVQVMIVGSFHMDNPGHDVYNLKVDDMLAPRRQTEIEALTKSLARFKPDRVAVEWSAEAVDQRYPKYLDGTLPPTRSERVQVGFRLAKLVKAKGVYGINEDGDFPYMEWKTYAESHGYGGLLEERDRSMKALLDEEQRTLDGKGVSGLLRLLNDPANIARDQGGYRDYLRVGAKNEQPGVDVLAGWYRRNLAICANLIQLAKPGDRIVVIYGAGHAFLLRQCVSETPGFQLVEANDYLP